MTTPPALIAALRHLLYPLVRLLVARGATYPMLAELLKEIYVDVASKEFRIEDEAPSDSRVSLLTGVHRKDVRRLRGVAQGEAQRMPESVALGAQLVAAWMERRPFRDAAGARRMDPPRRGRARRERPRGPALACVRRRTRLRGEGVLSRPQPARPPGRGRAQRAGRRRAVPRALRALRRARAGFRGSARRARGKERNGGAAGGEPQGHGA